MPSKFEAAWAARRGILTAHFAEAEGFRLEPQAKPMMQIAGGLSVPDVNAGSVPDPDPARPARDFEAVYRAKGAMLHAHGRSMADSTTRPIVAESATLVIDDPDLVAALRPDDIVLRRRTGTRYAITKAVPQQFGRAFVHLAEAP